MTKQLLMHRPRGKVNSDVSTGDDVPTVITTQPVEPADVAMLGLRVALGMLVFSQGMTKLGWFGGDGGIDGLKQFLQILGYDARTPLAWMLTTVEIASGLLLMAGAVTPLAAAAVIGIGVNLAFGLTWTSGYLGGASGSGYGFALLLVAGATAIAFVGPGRLSVDRLLKWPRPPEGMQAGIFAVALGAVTGVFVLTVLGPGFGSEPNAPSFPTDTAGQPAN
jgi:putative oxidoreductase